MGFQNIKKKGSVLDIIFIMILLFVTGITIVAGYTIYHKYSESIVTMPEFNTSRQQNITATANITLNSFDYLFVFIMVGLLIMVIISSFQIQTHPIFFFISIFLLIIAILLSSSLANIYESIIGEADFAAAGSQYVVMGYVFQHFPTVILIIGAILFIILFAKSRMEEYA